MDNKEPESLEFIDDIAGQAINHAVRHNEGIKGVVSIEIQTNGEYTVKVHRGTENQPMQIEGVSKERLLEMLEGQL